MRQLFLRRFNLFDAVVFGLLIKLHLGGHWIAVAVLLVVGAWLSVLGERKAG